MKAHIKNFSALTGALLLTAFAFDAVAGQIHTFQFNSSAGAASVGTGFANNELHVPVVEASSVNSSVFGMLDNEPHEGQGGGWGTTNHLHFLFRGLTTCGQVGDTYNGAIHNGVCKSVLDPTLPRGPWTPHGAGYAAYFSLVSWSNQALPFRLKYVDVHVGDNQENRVWARDTTGKWWTWQHLRGYGTSNEYMKYRRWSLTQPSSVKLLFAVLTNQNGSVQAPLFGRIQVEQL